MIEPVIMFLRDQLNGYMLQHCPIDNSNDANVGFITLGVPDHTFNLGVVNMLLINLEEEKYLKPANPYVQMEADGTVLNVSPPKRFNLYLLFAGFFTDYCEAVKQISFVIQYFQTQPVFTAERYLNLPSGVEKLIMELHSLEYARQNEIWSMLRVAYLPSVLYKVRMVTYQEESVRRDGEISEIKTRLSNR